MNKMYDIIGENDSVCLNSPVINLNNNSMMIECFLVKVGQRAWVDRK